MSQVHTPAAGETENKKKKIGEFLVEQGILEVDELEDLADQQKRDSSSASKRLVSLAVEQGIMDRKTASKVLGQYFGLPGIILKDKGFDPNLVPLLTLEMMYEGRYAPIEATDRFIFVAMSNPNDLETINWIELATGKRVRVMVALDDDILEAVQIKMDEAAEAEKELHFDDDMFDFGGVGSALQRVPESPPPPKKKAAKPAPPPPKEPESAPAKPKEPKSEPQEVASEAKQPAPLPAEPEQPPVAPPPAKLPVEVTALQEQLSGANERIASLEYRVQLLELVVAQVMEHLSEEEPGN